MAETTIEETPTLVAFADEDGVAQATIEAMAWRSSALRHSLPGEFTPVKAKSGVKLDVQAGGGSSRAVALAWERKEGQDG